MNKDRWDTIITVVIVLLIFAAPFLILWFTGYVVNLDSGGAGPLSS